MTLATTAHDQRHTIAAKVRRKGRKQNKKSNKIETHNRALCLNISVDVDQRKSQPNKMYFYFFFSGRKWTFSVHYYTFVIRIRAICQSVIHVRVSYTLRAFEMWVCSGYGTLKCSEISYKYSEHYQLWPCFYFGFSRTATERNEKKKNK